MEYEIDKTLEFFGGCFFASSTHSRLIWCIRNRLQWFFFRNHPILLVLLHSPLDSLTILSIAFVFNQDVFLVLALLMELQQQQQQQ